MPSLLAPNPSFAGHQTFAFRSGWLKKGLDSLQTDAVGGASVFGRPDAIVTLGVGKNMVQSIRHWLLVTQMAVERDASRGRQLDPTPLGIALFGNPKVDGWDGFLEDDATLWLLHWQLAGPGSGAFSWVWTFNMLRDAEFSKDRLVDAVLSATESRVGKVPSRETITRDVECLLHTYVSPGSRASDDELDCPLQSLGLLRAGDYGFYRFNIGPKPSLPAEVFLYALLRYWAYQHSSSEAVTLWDITYGDGSPGSVFKLDEDSVLEYLDDIDGSSRGALRFEDTPLVRNVVLNVAEHMDPVTMLRHYYG